MDIGKNTNTEQTTDKKPEKNNKKLLLIILGVLVVVFMILQIITKVSEQHNAAETPDTSVNIPNDTEQKDKLIDQTMQEAQQQLGDDFYNQASGGAPLPDTIAANTQPGDDFNKQPAAQNAAKSPSAKAKAVNEQLVTIDITNVGRANPFVPSVNLPGSYDGLGIPKPPPSLYPAPPTELVSNPDAVKLMETTISGIMYDAFSPSAIVNVDGQDHLVRKGDRINGYKIVNITRDRVVVQNGTNVYRATVGETLSTQNSTAVNFNNVYNLQHKFGGANASANTRMIQIN